LESWIDSNGWAGFDPYDLRGTRPYQAVSRWGPGRACLAAVERLTPRTARRLTGVKPMVNAKAVALLALGYLARFAAARDESHKRQALSCLQWLEANASPGYAGACWGYPFDWYTRIAIPAGTPSGVVSAIAGTAFLEAYRLFSDRRYLEVAASVADFLLEDLTLDRLDGGRACFSYTPLDRFHVHNANLLVAAHLAEVAALAGEERYGRHVDQAVEYTLRAQNSDGSWFYWGAPDRLENNIDHYHTGSLLRSLDRLARATGRKEWLGALDRGFAYYADNFFGPAGQPKLFPNRPHPVDIHGCAEATLCLCALRERYDAAAKRLPAVVHWVVDNMQGRDGHFYYRRYRGWVVRIAYLRWAQAWMYLALATHAAALGRVHP
jgi:hypothetical protein